MEVLKAIFLYNPLMWMVYAGIAYALIDMFLRWLEKRLSRRVRSANCD